MTEPMDTDLNPTQIPEQPVPHHNIHHDDAIATTDAAQSSTDSESDSDSDSDDEAELASQLQTLESALSQNPANYDAYVQYIQLLRKMGEIEKLRQAREAMNELFPLTPVMWQEWAKDETTLSSRPDAVPTIEKLYERGVSDYLSVPLWLDYLNFIREHEPSIRHCSVAGVSKARQLFERAITAAGVHFSEGGKIWEAYREFEQAIFVTIDETEVEEKEKQMQRIRSIFHRQLSVPLADMNSTLLTYKLWEVEQGNNLDHNSSDLNDISPHVVSAYKKALEIHNARLNLEKQITSTDVPDSEKLPLFKRYLKFEESAGDPTRVQLLYERAVTEFPIVSDLWLDYTRYLDKTLKVGNFLKDVYHRATRNCPWVGELWVKYLLCLERACASEEEVSLVFEKALQCTFSSYEEYLDLFLTRIDGLRRRISATGEMQVLDYAVIRDTFQRASDYLFPYLKGTEAVLQLHAYWARLELNLANDIVAARGVWESLLKISGTMLEVWRGYISMEVEKGNLNEARSIYRRCYAKRFPGSGSEDICHSWLRFEREFGTLGDYDTALQKVSPRLEELALFRTQQESKGVTASAEAKELPSKKVAREKRKLATDLSEDQYPSKRPKDTNDTKKGTERDRGTVQRGDKQGGQDAPNKVGSSDTIPNLPEKKPKFEKPRYTDQCTLFISNLSLVATYEHLRDFFSDVGGVQSIRILKDKYTGKSRGLAYVDFSDDAHLNAALAKNKKMFMNKKVSIARSDPSRSKKNPGECQNDGKKGENIPSASGDEAKLEGCDSTDLNKQSDDRTSSKWHGNDGVEFRGKLMFAPRIVQTAMKKKAAEGEDETPKSNDEFRRMLLKK